MNIKSINNNILRNTNNISLLVNNNPLGGIKIKKRYLSDSFIISRADSNYTTNNKTAIKTTTTIKYNK